ncbi:MAG: hypothetical protein R3E96_01115 [Planctomycetota bacterium]
MHGYTVIDATSVLVTHLGEVLRSHLSNCSAATTSRSWSKTPRTPRRPWSTS